MITSQFLACYLFDHLFLKLFLHFSWNSTLLKVKALLSSETSGTDYPVTQFHITEERNPEPYRRENLTTCLLSVQLDHKPDSY
jgi:hypothetical protein